MLIAGKIKNLQIGFIFLILFCVVRPLSFLDINFGIAGLNFLEFFAIGISYLLIITIAINFRKMKFDLISISILYYCSYCFISILWGSNVEEISKVTLPFVFFFAIRVIINEPKQIKLLLTVLIISYCFPLVGSFYQIIQGISVSAVESITGIERYTGIFARLRIFSYAMFFISVFFYIQVIINQLRNRQIKWALLCLLIISFFCLFKTYARTAYLGLAIFWGISLWGYKKKYFFILLISSLIIGVLYLNTFERIFFKTQEMDINTGSSGRLFLWEHNFNLFLESSFDRKLLGHGLGVGSKNTIGSDREIWVSHNDYLHILLQLGVVGLLLFFLIHLLLLRDIYMSIIDKRTKFFYYGILFSVTFMTFATGALLYLVGISQQFWMIMGLLYVFRDFSATSSHSV